MNEKFIEEIPKRAQLMQGQTPQAFKLNVIKKAHELSKNDFNFTDDCELVIKHNLGKVFVINGSTQNIKVTYPIDIFIADKLFQLKSTSYVKNPKLENLKDKVIVIFGGTSGIGKASYELAKENQAKVFITSKSLGCDVSDYTQVENFLKSVYLKTNRIDYVINTAGILKMGKLEERNIKDIINDININYLGSVNVIKAAIPYLSKSNGAINLYTSSSYTRGRRLYSIYSSTKAAIVNLVQAMAEELKEKNIRINAINPERTATPMRYKAFGKEPENTLCPVETVAKLSLLTLISDLTGQIIDVKKNSL